jgi:hypothetical protein
MPATRTPTAAPPHWRKLSAGRWNPARCWTGPSLPVAWAAKAVTMMAASTVAAEVRAPDWYGPPLPHPRRHDGDKGGGQLKAEVTKRVIMMATRVASDDDGDGNGGKSDGNGNKGAGRATTRAMAASTTVVAMRVASNKEGEGSKAMETLTKLAGKQWQRQQRGQWRWGQGWRARMRTMARVARVMAMVQRGQLQGGG